MGLKCFIPRREIRSISSRGPIDTLSIYCLSERILDFFFLMGKSPFFNIEMFYLMGWDGMGWDGMGWDGVG